MYSLAHSRVLWELVRTRGEEEGLMNLNISFCKVVCKANLYDDDVEDLEMLLEAYFMQLDGTRNKILSVREYIDDTEDYVNIQLENQHNKLIQLQLTLTVVSFSIAFETLVAGLFGMNIPGDLYYREGIFEPFVGAITIASIMLFLIVL
ncbi:putative Mg2+ transporter protein, CorA-like/Zinc transport protein ZntB [Helianthus debilis subsp. tardiflorus]